MKELKIRRATLSALLVWVLGVAAFVGSYLVPVLANPETQANWVLALVLLPATALGARFYYKKGYQTHGLALGAYMFGIALVLDACITVPVFSVPEGGDYRTFFGDPVFWLIGLEYIALIALYGSIRNRVKRTGAGSAH